MKLIKKGVLEYFKLIEDPRVQGRCQHKLIDILAIALCARLCGAESFDEMEEFGEQREAWLREFLELKNGIPSHDTLRRVFSILDPKIMEIAFSEWVEDFRQSKRDPRSKGLDRISLDGKMLKGTGGSFNDGNRPLTLVNVFDHEGGICLGQLRAASTGNAETGAAVELLDWMNLAGTTVSVDAGLARKGFLQKLIEKKADFVVPVKGNAGGNFTELCELMSRLKRKGGNLVHTKQSNRAHGRVEVRECWVGLNAVTQLSDRFCSNYPGVRSIIEIRRERESPDGRYLIQSTDEDGRQSYEKNTGRTRKTSETVYFVSTLELRPKEAIKQVREHWGIENKLHWSLDVVFKEDNCRVREKVTSENLATLRKIAFNLLQTCTEKGSKNRKMKRASWNNDYLENLLMEK